MDKGSSLILIGKYISVLKSKNTSFKKIEGKIINETKNLLVIQSNNQIKKLIKNQHTFLIDGKTVKGKTLIGRMEERIKKWIKKKKIK